MNKFTKIILPCLLITTLFVLSIKNPISASNIFTGIFKRSDVPTILPEYFDNDKPVILPEYPDEHKPVILPVYPDEDRPVVLPIYPDEDESAMLPELPPTNNKPVTLPDNNNSNGQNDITDINNDKDAKDVTNLLLETFTLKVKQDDKEIKENGNIDYTKGIFIEYKFKVPVEGDYPTPEQYIKGGDYATAKIPKGLKILKNGEKKVHLDNDETKPVVGTLHFKDNTLKLVFSDYLNEADIYDVQVSILIELRYDNTNDFANPGNHILDIYGKKFNVFIPEVEPNILGQKEGSVDIQNKLINWKVKVESKFEDGSQGNLLNYIFEDNLTTVGEFKKDSFKINNVDDIETAKQPENGFDYKNNIITYNFQEKDGNIGYIYYQTEIPDDNYFTNKASKIKNIAKIKKGDKLKASFENQVSINQTWINKTGVSNRTNEGRFIQWTIDLNQPNYNFKKLQVFDELPQNTTWVSAEIQTFDGQKWVSKEQLAQPKDNIYNLGNVKEKTRLIINTRIDDSVSQIGEKTFKNTASLRWEDMTVKEIPASASVTVGINPLVKKGMGYNTSSKEISWNTTFDTQKDEGKEENYGEDLKIFELLIYEGKNSVDLNSITIEGIDSDEILKSLVPSYHQTYVDGSFQIVKGNGEFKVLPVLKDNKRVGDLLLITSSNNSGIESNSTLSFNYKTTVTDPNKYAINGGNSIQNNVSLYNENTKLFDASAIQSIKGHVVDKDMLSVANARNVEKNFESYNDVNSPNPPKAGAFDYINKTAIFRIHINSNGTDLTNLGEIIIQDKMPNGWEMKDIAGEPFLLYEGTKNPKNYKFVTAKKHIKSSEYDSFLSYTKENNIINFNFKSITKPYVLLVKIGPTDEKALEYFSKNRTYNEQNHATLINDNITFKSNDWEDFSIQSRIINKGVNSDNRKDGYLTWTIDYKPYGIKRDKISLRDMLPYGVELFRDKSGNIIFGDGGINLQELVLQDNGNYVLGDTIDASKYVFYNSDNRNLVVNFPDNSKGYKLTYKTNITGNVGPVRNYATLEGTDLSFENTNSTFIITEQDVTASLKRGGRFKITIKDNKGNPIPNIELVLVSSGNVIRQDISNNKGIIDFKAIPQGEYTLIQTKVPDDFAMNKNEIPVKIERLENGKFEIKIGDTVIENKGIDFVNYLKSSVGSIKVSKNVIGENADLNKKFEFTLNINSQDTFSYNIYNNLNEPLYEGKIKNGGTFLLSHNQYAVINNIPNKVQYSIKEKDYTSEDYTTSYVENKNSGTVEAGKTDEIQVLNKYNIQPGALVISKVVSGKDADLNKKFKFNLNVTNDSNANYMYSIIYNNTAHIEKGNLKDKLEFELGHNDTIYIYGLPFGTEYEVIEDPQFSKEYNIKSINEKGILTEQNKSAEVIFENEKVIDKGSLKITKKVIGEGADLSKYFKFKINFDSQDTFNYTINNELNGQIKSGDTIQLKNNDYIIIKDIPENTKYEIEEDIHFANGYIISSENEKGTIVADNIINCIFTNKLKDNNNTNNNGEDNNDNNNNSNNDGNGQNNNFNNFIGGSNINANSLIINKLNSMLYGRKTFDFINQIRQWNFDNLQPNNILENKNNQNIEDNIEYNENNQYVKDAIEYNENLKDTIEQNENNQNIANNIEQDENNQYIENSIKQNSNGKVNGYSNVNIEDNGNSTNIGNSLAENKDKDDISKNSKGYQTGDNFSLLNSLFIILVCILSLAGIIIYKKRKL